MIFLYTINNTGVLLPSHPHRSGFVILLHPGKALRSVRLDHPLSFPPPTSAAEQVCEKSIRTALGWTDHVSYPPGREVTGAMSHNCHMKNTAEACCDCQMQVLIAGLACQELKMHRGRQFHSHDGQCSWQNNALIVKEKLALQTVNWL